MHMQHIIAASLLIASLTTASLSDTKIETPPPAPDKCLTRKDVLKQADVLFDLAGEELKTFHKHYTEQYHKEPPDIDRLMVINLGNNEVVLLMKLEHDCVTGMQYVPLDAFMEVMKGKGS